MFRTRADDVSNALGDVKVFVLPRTIPRIDVLFSDTSLKPGLPARLLGKERVEQDQQTERDKRLARLRRRHPFRVVYSRETDCFLVRAQTPHGRAQYGAGVAGLDDGNQT